MNLTKQSRAKAILIKKLKRQVKLFELACEELADIENKKVDCPYTLIEWNYCQNCRGIKTGHERKACWQKYFEEKVDENSM